MVTDETIEMFVRLIRTSRQGKFVQFLRVLCTHHSTAIRINQWRVCQKFLVDAPELQMNFTLEADPYDPFATFQIMVSGDAEFFPEFLGRDSMELGEWLDQVLHGIEGVVGPDLICERVGA